MFFFPQLHLLICIIISKLFVDSYVSIDNKVLEMSNNPHRTHKRQKSSVLNPGYYFTPETKLEIQQQQPQQQESQQQQQQQQQQHSQTHNIYDNDNYMNYNFPPTSNRPRASTTTGTTSTTHPGSELSHESHSVHTSPLKRTASSELDQPIPAMAPSSP